MVQNKTDAVLELIIKLFYHNIFTASTIASFSQGIELNGQSIKLCAVIMFFFHC